MLCVMNFKTKMKIKDQLKMMNEIEQHQFQPELMVAPSILGPNRRSNFEVVSQDLSTRERTVGEIPEDELKYYGVKYTFIGHIERRTVLNENYDVINDKLKNALKNNITPIITVGLSGDHPDKVIDEFNWIVKDADLSHHHIIIAWESTASDEYKRRVYSEQEAKNLFNALRKRLSDYDDVHYRLLLGGHVGSDEAALAKNMGIDGVLIGDRFRDFDTLNTILKPLTK